MSLKYLFFKTNKLMNKAANNNPPLRKGTRNSAVKLLQGALIDMGYNMPLSKKIKGLPDGIFGHETFDVVKKFQAKYKLKVDGIAGRNTITRLDGLMFKKVSAIPP